MCGRPGQAHRLRDRGRLECYMRQSHRLVFNVLATYGSQVLEAVVQVFLLRFVLLRLGSKDYGIFLLAFSLAPVMQLIVAGVAKATTRYLAAYLANNETDRLGTTVSAAVAYCSAAGMAALAIVLVLRPYAGAFFHLESAERLREFEASLAWVAVYAALVFPLSPFLGCIYARQRYDLASLIQLGNLLLRAGLIVAAFLVWEPSVRAVAAITVACEALAQIACVVVAYRLMPGMKVRPFSVRWRQLRPLMTFGGYVVGMSLLMMVISQGSKWIAGGLLAAEYISYLAIVMTPMVLARRGVQSMTVPMMPVASKYQTIQRDGLLQELVTRGARYGFLVSLAVVVGLLALVGPVLESWLGPEYRFLAPYMAVVLVCLSAAIPADSADEVLVGMGAVKPAFFVTLGGMAAAVGLMIGLVKFLDWGFWGLVAGISAAFLVRGVGLQWLAVVQTRGSVARFAWRAYGQPLVAAAPAIGLAFWLAREVEVDGWLSISAIAGAAVAVYATLFLLLFVRPEEKRLAAEVLRAGWARLCRPVARSDSASGGESGATGTAWRTGPDRRSPPASDES